jgi:cell division septal protein FtsQ
MLRARKYSKKIKKDYQSKNLCNPFFRQPKKNLSRKMVYLFVFLTLIFAGALLWFFLACPLWQIKSFKIEGLTRINGEEIENRALEQMRMSAGLLFEQNNIYLFDKDKFKENILTTYNFSDLEIIKKLPGTLLIKISERPYAFIFQQGSDYFYASRDAYIIPEAKVSDEDKTKYFILENKNTDNLVNSWGKISLSDAYLGFIFTLADYLKISQEVEAEKYVIDVEFNTIKVKFKDGPLVYFNTRNEAIAQLERLILVKKEKIKDNFSKTNYIDLRYGDKIFIN